MQLDKFVSRMLKSLMPNRKQSMQKNRTVAQILYANDGGSATFQLGIPEVAQQVGQHVAEQKLMANGINPQIPFTSNRLPV